MSSRPLTSSPVMAKLALEVSSGSDFHENLRDGILTDVSICAAAS